MNRTLPMSTMIAALLGVTVLGTTTLTGTLPVPPSVTGGTFTVTTGGESYSSTFTTAPLPSPGPTPTPGSSPSPSPSPGTGAFTFQLVSKSADCNFSEAGFTGLPVESAIFSGAQVRAYTCLRVP